MISKSKYSALLAPLMTQPCFSAEQARLLGVPSPILAYLEKTEVVQRIDRGIYRNPLHEIDIPPQFEGIVTTSLTVPNSVICLISALFYYDLTEEIPRKTWIAIPHSQRAPVRGSVRAVRMRNMLLGQTIVEIGDYSIPIFDQERCLVDAFRYLSIEIAIKAIKIYLSSSEHHPNLRKLESYAKQMHVDLTPYILSFTT